jgi:hypothetical protein
VNKNITAGSQLREDILIGRDVGDLQYSRIHDVCRKQDAVDLAIYFREILWIDLHELLCRDYIAGKYEVGEEVLYIYIHIYIY